MEEASIYRKREEWLAEIPRHIDEYLAKGGTIRQCYHGESTYQKRYEDGTAKGLFVINRGRG